MLNDKYWSERYQNNSDTWDIGYCSPALKSLLDETKDKEIKILIPGCGNAYEAAYAFESGFIHTYIIDWAIEPLNLFKKQYPHFPNNQIIHADFFKHEGKYDLILEQTFYCAIQPTLRKDYVKKCAELLNDHGALKGLFFNCYFETDGPPFGGNISEYKEYFEEYFMIKRLENCPISIEPRKGNELIFEFYKKPTI